MHRQALTDKLLSEVHLDAQKRWQKTLSTSKLLPFNALALLGRSSGAHLLSSDLIHASSDNAKGTQSWGGSGEGVCGYENLQE